MPIEQVLTGSLLFGLTVGLMMIGLAGIFLPGLPGLPLVWLAAAVYAVLDGFRTLDGWTLAALTVLAVVGSGAELAATQWGTRAGGGSRGAGLAALAGGLIGLLAGPLGLLIGAPLAVLLFELVRQRQVGKALRSSGGWLVGWALGRGMQLAIGVVMIVTFMLHVLLAN